MKYYPRPRYVGRARQRGGGLADGLGGIFRILGRNLLPLIAKSAKPFIKRQAQKALPSLARAGLGLVKDLQGKTTFKQAVKQRGKRLANDVISGVLNSDTPPVKRHKTNGRRRVNTAQKKLKKRKISRDVFS